MNETLILAMVAVGFFCAGLLYGEIWGWRSRGKLQERLDKIHSEVCTAPRAHNEAQKDRKVQA